MNSIVKVVVSSLSCVSLFANVDAMNHHIAYNNYNRGITRMACYSPSNTHVSTNKHVAVAPLGKEFRPEIRRLDKTRPTKEEVRRNVRHERKAEIKKAMND